MRLQYRVLIVLAALLVAAATFYPVPMQAGPDQKKDAAKKESAEKEITAKVEVTSRVTPVYPAELRKDGYSSDLLLKIKIDEKGLVIEAIADSIAVFSDRGALTDKERKRVAAIFEKSAADAARQWTFKVESTGGKADTIEVMIPINFKLH